jgi:hypothetical protein
LIYQSSGEFFNYFICPIILSTIPVPNPPSSAAPPDDELQSPLPRTFPPESIKQPRKEAASLTTQEVSYSFFIGPII